MNVTALRRAKGGRLPLSLFRILLVGATLTMAVSAAQAALVAVNWKASQDDLLTRDSESGLDWLDITQTYGKTINQVLAQTGSGGLYEGFRMATRGEFELLYSHAGLETSSWASPPPVATDPAKIDLALVLLELLGHSTYSDLGERGRTSAGSLQGTFSPGLGNYGYVNYTDTDLPWAQDYYRASVTGVQHDSIVGNNIGVWLVRDSSTSPFIPDVVVPDPSDLPPDPQAALPVPGSLWLIAGALLALGPRRVHWHGLGEVRAA